MAAPVALIAAKGSLGTTPWVVVLGYMARRRLSGRVDIELLGENDDDAVTTRYVRFADGVPTGLFDGPLERPTPVPGPELATALVDLAKVPASAAYAIRQGAETVEPFADFPVVPVEPIAVALRAVTAAPPRKRSDEALAAAAGRKLALRPFPAVEVPRPVERLVKRIGVGARTVEMLLGGSKGEDRARDELYVYAMLQVGVLVVIGDTGASVVRVNKSSRPPPMLDASESEATKDFVRPEPASESKHPAAAAAGAVVVKPFAIVETKPGSTGESVSISIQLGDDEPEPPPEPELGPPSLRTDAEGLDAQAHYERATRSFFNGALTDASFSLASALALDPDHTDARALAVWLAVLPARDPTEGEIGVAIVELGQILKDAPRCERALYYRGALYKRINRPGKALADLQAAAELAPRAADVQTELRLLRPKDSVAPPANKTSSKAPPKFEPLFEKKKPVSEEAARKRRYALLAVVAVVLGVVAVYVNIPPRPPPPGSVPKFDWLPPSSPS